MYRPKVYTASKIHLASQWRELRDVWFEIEFTSRWIDMDHLETKRTPSPKEFIDFWTIDIQDVRRSDFVLCFGGDDSSLLRGALVEAGAALALGKIVLAIDVREGTWVHHPCVVQLSSLSEARRHLQIYGAPR